VCDCQCPAPAPYLPPYLPLQSHPALPASCPLLAPTCLQEFDSPQLKNKKHWNSFTHPNFFLDADWVLGQLQQALGRLEYSTAAAEAALKADLRCGLRLAGCWETGRG